MYMTTEINQLPRKDLLNLIWEYNSYVIEIVDKQDGSIPACLSEFYQNDYEG